jgi:hypothetical protein
MRILIIPILFLLHALRHEAEREEENNGAIAFQGLEVPG